ncbi:MAG: amidohydrolase family protein [Armatimonadia bacterium]
MSISLQQQLLAEIGSWEIIDCHEHLAEERYRLEKPVDALTFFGHYTHNDLITAGMTREDYDRLFDHSLPLDERWQLVKPYWARIRFTGYARAIRIALPHFYGFDDLTDDTIGPITERMQANNTPGLYNRVLREACRIRLCLTQVGRIPDANRDLLVPILPVGNFAHLPDRAALEARAAVHGITCTSNLALKDLLRAELRHLRQQGVVGLKMVSHPAPEQPDQSAVNSAFSALLEDRQHDAPALQAFLQHELLEAAADENLVVAVHCGLIWSNWGDFTATNPLNMVPLLLAHRRTRFDLYHAGLPWIRETGVIGKTFPNVWLNLCWTHIISPQMSISALNEWLDLVPYNKILGFGGDYGVPIEKVYGHLQLALQDIAAVLASRIESGWMTDEEALQVAHGWLWDNPVELYSLERFLK